MEQGHECTENSTKGEGKKRILVGVSGSVATIKLIELVSLLLPLGEVIVVTTKSAQHFFDKTQLPKGVPVYTDENEWESWKKLRDPVLHIELRKWADVLILAPLSANTLAKLANGISDNLLTCIARAWNFKRPFIVAPAMNTLMWDHPFTAKHLSVLKELGIVVIDPIAKKMLACGDIGPGAMEEPKNIAAVVKEHLAKIEYSIHDTSISFHSE